MKYELLEEYDMVMSCDDLKPITDYLRAEAAEYVREYPEDFPDLASTRESLMDRFQIVVQVPFPEF
jgi:hypothetical protein